MNEDRDISNFEKLASKTKEQLIASKEKSTGCLHIAADASAAQIEKAGDFNTGEVSGPGKLTCTNCRTVFILEEPSPIPPCTKCHNTDFRKSY